MAGAPVFKVWSESYDHRRKRAVHLWINNPDGSEYFGKLEFPPVDMQNNLIGENLWTIPAATGTAGVDGIDFLQTILNHAWEIGMRPVGFLDTTKEVSSLREHLHDMRALVFSGKIEPTK